VPREDAEDLAVRITLRDIYEQQVVMSSKLDGSLATHLTQEATIADHETRLRGLERWRYALPTALVLAAAGVIGNFVMASLTLASR
jgi:hypothetical protein